MTRIVKYGL